MTWLCRFAPILVQSISLIELHGTRLYTPTPGAGSTFQLMSALTTTWPHPDSGRNLRR